MKLFQFIFGLLPIIFAAIGTLLLLRGANIWEEIFKQSKERTGIFAELALPIFEKRKPSDIVNGLKWWLAGIISQILYLVITVSG